MKSILTLLLACFLSLNLMAQEKLPAFKMYDLKGNAFTEKNIVAGKTSVFVFFDPSCEHCELQGQWIAQDLWKFYNTQFYFVSISDPNEIAKYRDRNFPGLNQVKFIFDKDYATYKSFQNIDNTPSTVIFDKNGKRVAFFSKETPAADIIKVLPR